MTILKTAGDLAELFGQSRLASGWTFEQFACEVDVSHAYASLLCGGKRTPRLPMAISILDRLGYDLVAVKR
jgi:transcriptional regulator with XRE-family HTH domain